MLSTFTVVAVEDRLKDFKDWDVDNPNDEGSRLYDSSALLSPKGLGSKNELGITRGDIIKVLAACDPDGSKRRPIQREVKRLDSGFLDSGVPMHDPYDVDIWWVGTVVKGGKETKIGRFPQRCVALMAELRAQRQTFRCKMCSKMMKKFITNKTLDNFGITGQANHLFGARDLCDGCGPKILRVIKSVTQSLLEQPSDEAAMDMVRVVAKKKFLHETAMEAYALTPERLPEPPKLKRPEGSPNAVSSPRTNKVSSSSASSTSSTNSSSSSSSDNYTYEDPRADSLEVPLDKMMQEGTSSNNLVALSSASSSLSSKESSSNTKSRVEELAIKGSDNPTQQQQAVLTSPVSTPTTTSNSPPALASPDLQPATSLAASDTTSEKDEQIPLNSLKSLGNPSELMPGLQLLFSNACAEEGHLTKDHILRMVQRLAKDHVEARNFTCGEETAELIIGSLDADGNGTIEFDEWSRWIVRGAMRTKEERNRFKEKNEIMRDTMFFLETIATIAKKLTLNPGVEVLRPALIAIYEDAILTEEGHLYPEDLVQMVAVLKKEHDDLTIFNDWEDCTSRMASTIVQSLDNDESGSVEMDEFVPWLMSGMSQSDEDRARFASQGTTFALLIQFMESIGCVAKKMEKKIRMLLPGVENLFEEYSRPGGVSSGDNIRIMTSEDLQEMIKDLAIKYRGPQASGAGVVWFHCDLTVSNLLVQCLDEDENGTIEKDEFVNWVLKGAAKSKYARAKFGQQRQDMEKLTQFLTCVIYVAGLLGGNAAEEENKKEKEEEKKEEKKKVSLILQQQRDRVRESECLRNVPAFAALSNDHISAVIDTMVYAEFDDDEPQIIEQGKVADRVYVILTGQVSIMAASGAQGWPKEKRRIGELQVFGVESLFGLDNQRYTVSGVICDDLVQTLCLKVPNNPILGENSEEIVKAAREARDQEIAAKASKKLRDNFLAKKKSGSGGE